MMGCSQNHKTHTETLLSYMQFIYNVPSTLTSSVSNALAILARHVSTTEVCSSLGVDDMNRVVRMDADD